MSMSCLYTSTELIAKLKDLDSQMDDATTKSDLDTGQTKHEITISIRTLREQYEKYKGMLKRCDPAAYKCFFGSGAIRFVKCR